MKKVILKVISAVAALIVALPCAVAPAFANSGPVAEYGVAGGGVLFRNENSVLAVESEKLTFDIKDFPQIGVENASKYKSTVTAEYKFVNTSDETVRTSMAFPLGNVPDYFYYYGTETENALGGVAPTITVDGKDVETEIRYTYGNYNYYANFAEGVSEISDEWYETDFYKPDMPITTYKVFADRGRYSDIAVYGSVTCDNGKVRYMSGNGYGNEMPFYFYETSSSYESLVESGQYVFYVLGDKSEFNVEWTVMEERYHHGGIKRTEVDIPVEVTEMTNKDGTPLYATLKDFILSRRQSNSIISDLDYYNAMSRYFRDCKNDDAYVGDFRYMSSSDRAFCIWYTYDVEVGSKGSFTNTVTAPIYPTIDTAYNPYVYEYEYYLSPAKGWASFGKLQIDINSDAYFLSSSLSVDSSSDGRYHATFDTLPEDELTFRLCSVEDPSYEYYGRGIPLVALFIILGIVALVALAVPIAGVIVAIVYLAKNGKQKR